MKINSLRIFSLLIIAIILLSAVESRKKNKKQKGKKHRLNAEAASMVTIKGFDWEKDDFLKELKNQEKYALEANTTKKWYLIMRVIGKCVSLLGVKNEDVETGLKTIKNEKMKLEAFNIVMKFQKSMNLDDLKPIATKWTFKGLSETNFTPDKRTKLLTFLNCHVRQP